MKHKILQLFTVVLGSIWFFPFNCIAALTVGTILIANMDNREFEKGVQVGSSFSVVVEPGDNGRPFHQETGEKYSFLMSDPAGSLNDDYAGISYREIADRGSEQVIEVADKYHHGDNPTEGSYGVTQTEISPMTSDMFYFGYMFTAYPFALGTALLLYGVGIFLRRKFRYVPAKSSNS
jgi:hypothetical protein